MTQQTLASKPATQPDDEPTEAQPAPTRSSGGSGLVQELIRVVVSVAIIAAGATAAVMLVNKNKKAPESKEVVASLPEVETIEIVTHEGGLDIDVDGVAVPFKEIQLAAEVAGRVEFKSTECRAGNFVKKGTELIRIDRQTYQLEVDRLTQQQLQAGQNLQELQQEIENAGRLIAVAKDDQKLRAKELARQIGLRSRGVGTDTAVESAERSRLQADNALAQVENQEKLLVERLKRLATAKELARIQLERAELDLERTTIVAPIDGVIVSEMVEADSFVQRGSSLVTLEDTSAVEVRCNLTMDELYRLWESSDATQRGEYDVPDTVVTVLYELAGRQFAWEGRLARFDGLGLDQRTRTVPCRIAVPEPRKVMEYHGSESMVEAKGGPPALVRGMFVTARLHTNPDTKYLRVPQRAVRPGKEVWLVRKSRKPTKKQEKHAAAADSDATASKPNGDHKQASEPARQIKVVKAQVVGVAGTSLLIDGTASGIRPGDKAVVSPLVEVHDGLQVQEKTSK